jgi:hypothetical protein
MPASFQPVNASAARAVPALADTAWIDGKKDVVSGGCIRRAGPPGGIIYERQPEVESMTAARGN